MVEFRESSEELFLALPLIYQHDPEMAETVLTELRRRASGDPLNELTELWAEAAFREATTNWPEAIALSEQAMAKCKDLHFLPYQLRAELATLVRRRLNVTDPGQRLRADQEIEQLAEGGSDAPLADALFLRATTRLSEANVLDSDPAELDSDQRATAIKAMADIERAAGCEVDRYQRGNIMLARTGICRILGLDEEGMRLTGEAIAFFRDRFPATSLPPASGPTGWFPCKRSIATVRSCSAGRIHLVCGRYSSARTMAGPNCSATRSPGHRRDPTVTACLTVLPIRNCVRSSVTRMPRWRSSRSARSTPPF